LTGLIAIDESGDLGSRGSKFFVIAAIVTRRSRHLLKVYKSIPIGNDSEVKFYEARHNERLDILTELAESESSIVYVCVNKKDYREPCRHGNKLYLQALKRLIECTLEISESKDVDISVDESRFIKSGELAEMGKHISKDLGKNVKKCVKVSSNKCTRVTDYVAGAIWAKYEHGKEEYFEVIEKRISIACESLGPRKSATDSTGLIRI